MQVIYSLGAYAAPYPALTFCYSAKSKQKRRRLRKFAKLHITLESNGTLFHPKLFELIDLISLSPKPSTSFAGKSTEAHYKRTKETTKRVVDLRRKGTDFQLKFVMSSPRDIDEIKEMTSDIEGIRNDDILLMPLGSDDIELNQTAQLTSLLSVENGWRYCPRLHIDIWGNLSGI